MHRKTSHAADVIMSSYSVVGVKSLAVCLDKINQVIKFQNINLNLDYTGFRQRVGFGLSNLKSHMPNANLISR